MMIKKLFLMSVLCGAVCVVESSVVASDHTKMEDPLEPARQVVRYFYPNTDINGLLTGDPSQHEGQLREKIKSAILEAANDPKEFCTKILFHGVRSEPSSSDHDDALSTSIRGNVLALDFERLRFTVTSLTYEDKHKVSNTFPALIFQYDDKDEATMCINHEKRKIDPTTGLPEQVPIAEYKRLGKIPPYMPALNTSEEDLVKLMKMRSIYNGHVSKNNCAHQ